MQRAGVPRLSSAVIVFKTTCGETVAFTFPIFVFKMGASREKDVTDDLSFTYSVPRLLAVTSYLRGQRPSPAPLYAELVKEGQAAARAQSTALCMP